MGPRLLEISHALFTSLGCRIELVIDSGYTGFMLVHWNLNDTVIVEYDSSPLIILSQPVGCRPVGLLG